MTDDERDAIERSCKKLSIAYAKHADFRDYNTFVDLFTEDGVLEIYGQEIKGRAALLATMSSRPENRRSLHLLTNIWIDVLDADHAVGGAYLTVFSVDFDGDGPAPLQGARMVGNYEDEFVRGTEGWRIARRKLTAVFKK